MNIVVPSLRAQRAGEGGRSVAEPREWRSDGGWFNLRQPADLNHAQMLHDLAADDEVEGAVGKVIVGDFADHDAVGHRGWG